MSILKACAIFILVSWLALIAAATCTMAHDAADHPSLAGWAEEQLVTPQYGKNFPREGNGICPDPQATPWNINCKCCVYSEIIEDAEYRLSKDREQIIDGRAYKVDEWWYKRAGSAEWKLVPDDTVHWGEHSPDGRGVLFLLPGTSTPRCFFPPKTDL